MSRDLAERVHRRLLDTASPGGPLRERLESLARTEAPLLDDGSLRAVVDAVAARASGLGALEPLLGDPAVSEIMCNGGGPVWVERAGRLERLDLSLDADDVALLIERVLLPLGLRVDRTAPLVDARLADGSRVNAVVPPLAIDGPCLTIRRFGVRAIGLDELAAPDVAAFLRASVVARRNVVVAGGTGAGKTTLLNALAACLPPGERVVTIEDAAELRLPLEHVVRLEARPANAEGAGAVSVRALDMVQAMNTGHDGSLSTCHANGPADALRRLETMILTGAPGLPLAAVREQLAASIDLVVHVARRPGGDRRVVAVSEVVALGDAAGVQPLAVHALAGEHGMVAEPQRRPRAEQLA
jgi:pilus assembly protein CpaF